MKERRALVEGLAAADQSQQDREKAFVYGASATAESNSSAAVDDQTSASREPTVSDSNVSTQYDSKVLPQFAGRVPVTTRARPEVATALKRASLTRQLNGIEPFYVQDIMEQALEAWLRTNGYLS
jgi:hypothetical protein